MGGVTGEGECARGQQVTANATANEGNYFIRWEDEMGSVVSSQA